LLPDTMIDDVAARPRDPVWTRPATMELVVAGPIDACLVDGALVCVRYCRPLDGVVGCAAARLVRVPTNAWAGCDRVVAFASPAVQHQLAVASDFVEVLVDRPADDRVEHTIDSIVVHVWPQPGSPSLPIDVDTIRRK
jgi:hypothetical protein